MANFSRIAAVLFSIALLSACSAAQVKVGRDFDVDTFAAKVQQGVTTKKQISSWLGDPASVGVSLANNGERFDEWVYYFAEGKLADMSAAKVKTLQIRFDQLDAVRSYDWSASRK